MKLYRSSRLSKRFAWIGIACYLLLLLLMIAKPFLSDNNETPSAAIVISAIVMTFLLIMMIDVLKSTLEITENYIHHKSLFQNQKISISDIQGFRENKRLITIESNEAGRKAIQIRRTLENSDEIVEWLSSRFPNLDQQKV